MTPPGNLSAVAGGRGAGGQLLHDLIVQPATGVARGYRQRVLDRPVARRAVADDADAVDAQERSAAVFAVVVAVHQSLQRLLALLAFDIKSGEDFLKRHLHDELEDALASLQHHVADEAIADHDIRGAAVNVAALDIADELLAQAAGVEERVRVLGEIVPLLLLLADVHQTDGRTRSLKNVPCEDAAHHPVLEQMRGLGADVGADIDQHAGTAQGLHDGGDTGTAHALDEQPVHEAAGDHRPRIARRDDAIDLLLPQ